jgi:hypothetical protein
MRTWMGISLLLPFMLTSPAKADFLLNCRLMNPETRDHYRQHCKWETVVKCEPGKACIIKRQNFVSGYSNSVLSANPQWLAAVSINDPDSGLSTVAGVSRPVGVPGADAEILATGSDVGHELSGALDNAASAATRSLGQ